MRERIAYLFMITMLIILVAVVFAVLGKGEYKPPDQDQQGNAPEQVSVIA